jgi:hypothetical protein
MFLTKSDKLPFHVLLLLLLKNDSLNAHECCVSFE